MSNSGWMEVMNAARCCMDTQDPEKVSEPCKGHLFRAQGTPAPSPQPTVNLASDPIDSGINADSQQLKKGLGDAASSFDRFAGVCSEVAKTCESFAQQASYPACASQASTCSKVKTKSDFVLTNADKFITDRGTIDPGLSGSNPGGGPSPGDPGGAPTQQPGGGAGGGSPLQDIMSALQQAMQPKPKEPVDTTPQSCETNPSLAGCPLKPASTGDSWNKKAGESGFDGATTASDSPDSFDVPSNDGLRASSYSGNGERPLSPPPSGGAGVPNGGGAMPGGGGGGGAAAGAGAGSAGFAGPQKKLTDIMQGMMAGGYSQMNQGMKMENGAGGGGFSGYGGGRGEYKPGMDLRQFLPGGKNDPTRKIAGRVAPGTADIQPQTVNIWNRISERIRARCTQGLLRDCGP